MASGNDFREVLGRMRDKFGLEVFRNPKRMFAILRDLAPGLEAESNVLRQLADRGLFADLERLSELDRLGDADADARRGRVLMKLRNCLTDYLQLSEERADYYAALLLDLYGLPNALPRRLPAGRAGQLAWTLDENGLFTVFGSGPMDNYAFSSDTVDSPWWRFVFLRLRRPRKRRDSRKRAPYRRMGVRRLREARRRDPPRDPAPYRPGRLLRLQVPLRNRPSPRSQHTGELDLL